MDQHTHRRRHRPVLRPLVCLLAASLALIGCEGPSAARLEVLGDEAFAEGRYEEALASYEAALEKAPNDAEAHHNRGLALLALDRPLEARESFAVAYDLEPENEAYLGSLVDALVEAGRDDRALELLEGLANDELTAEAFIRLGDLQRRLGLPDEARVSYRRAAAVSEGSKPEPYRALAELYRRLGDDEAELRQLSYVLYLDPEDQRASSRVRELGEIPGPSFRREPPDRE